MGTVVMLFRTKVFLGNLDSVVIARTGLRKVRRRLHSAMLYGNGVVLSAASLLDNSYVSLLFDCDEFYRHMNFCRELHDVDALIYVRGLSERSFVRRFDYIDDSFIFSSLGGLSKGEIIKKKYDYIIRARLEKLDEMMCQYGAVFEDMPGRELGVRRSMSDFVERSLIKGDLSGWRISVTHQGVTYAATPRQLLDVGIHEIVSRSDCYRRIDDFVAEWGRNLDAEVGAKLSGKIKRSLIDPAYHGLFVDKGEALLEGEFTWLSEAAERLLVSEVRARRLARNGYEWLSTDHPKIVRLLPQIPMMLGRSVFIAKAMTSSSAADILVPIVFAEAVKSGCKAALAWGWLRAYDHLRQRMGIQRFDTYQPVECLASPDTKFVPEAVARLGRLVMAPMLYSDLSELISFGEGIVNGTRPEPKNLLEESLVEVLPKPEGNEMKDDATRKVYENNWFEVLNRDGFFWVHEPRAMNGAVILPVLPDGSMVLVEVFRPAQGEVCLELPRGYGDDGEDSIDCAVRELREETNFVASRNDCRILGNVRPNSAILSARVDVVQVNVSGDVGQGRSGDEVSLVRIVDQPQFAELIASGAIADGFTLAAYALFSAAHHRIPQPFHPPVPHCSATATVLPELGSVQKLR